MPPGLIHQPLLTAMNGGDGQVTVLGVFELGDEDVVATGENARRNQGRRLGDEVQPDAVLAAVQSWWCDYNYEPATAAAMLDDATVMATASIDQIKTMLTYCVRGERFADGHWGEMLASGRITALLRRLVMLQAG